LWEFIALKTSYAHAFLIVAIVEAVALAIILIAFKTARRR